MKLIEKLAREFSAYLEDDVQLKAHRELAEESFQAGFRKAREMAVELAGQYPEPTEATVECYCQLGESET